MNKKGFSVVGAVITVVVLLAVAANFIIYFSAQKKDVVSPADTSSKIPSGWKTYINSEFGYKVGYPSDYILDSETDRRFMPGAYSDSVLRNQDDLYIALPKEVFPQTTYGGAYFIVVVREDKSSVDNCYNPQLEYTRSKNEKIVVNGSSFYRTIGGNEGTAGLSFSNEIYNIISNQSCYNIILTVGQASPANFDKLVSPFDSERAFLLLRQILNTFSFTNQTSPVSELTIDKILNSNGFVNGKKENGVPGTPTAGGEEISGIIFGKDSDGTIIAAGIHIWCGASCGKRVAAFKLVNGNVLMVDLPDTSVGGAAQNISSIQINNGIISSIETDFDGTRTTYYQIAIINGALKANKITPPNNPMNQATSLKAYADSEIGLYFKYPSSLGEPQKGFSNDFISASFYGNSTGLPLLSIKSGTPRFQTGEQSGQPVTIDQLTSGKNPYHITVKGADAVRVDSASQDSWVYIQQDFKGKIWIIEAKADLLNQILNTLDSLESQDNQRLTDLNSLQSAIALYMSDGNKLSCVSGRVYTSINGTTAVNGAGWLPIDFTKITSGSPLKELSKDPINDSTSYYSFACDPVKQTFEFDARLQSTQHKHFMIEDGGNNDNLYELGSDPGLKLIK